MENKRKLGQEKEAFVCAYLTECGYEIVCRNFYSRHGEIDIVAKKDGYLVFIEVKYRKSTQFGMPEEAVGFRKQQNLLAAAKYYLYKNHLPFDIPMRFDVVGVLCDTVRITENAFECGN